MPWYKTGTATVTSSSATVTGAGTAWVDNTRIGDAFIGPDGLVYEITARASDTSLTIAPPYKSATGSARPYVIAPMQGYVKTLADQAQLLINSTEPIVPAGTTAQYYRGDKTWQTLNNTAVGLGSVNNTSDASKPVSTAQQTALNLKANLASPIFTGTVGGVTKAMVGLANADNTSDASKPVSTAQAAAIAARYGKNNILGTVSQSAGVPTGAVIERGSNANGEYVRFADGTQICTLSLNDKALAANFVGSLGTMIFPATFIAAPHLSGSAGPNTTFDWYGVTGFTDLTTVSVAVAGRNGSTAQTAIFIRAVAVGRWF